MNDKERLYASLVTPLEVPRPTREGHLFYAEDGRPYVALAVTSAVADDPDALVYMRRFGTRALNQLLGYTEDDVDVVVMDPVQPFGYEREVRIFGGQRRGEAQSPALRAIVQALADPKVRRPDWFNRAALGRDVTELAEAVERVLMTHGLLR